MQQLTTLWEPAFPNDLHDICHDCGHHDAGKDKHEAVTIALTTSMKSIMVSALGFFASTFGVGVYSSVDMISQLCTLMSRGAIISMITVICILPSMLMLFDKVIINTTMGMKKKENKLYKLPEIN